MRITHGIIGFTVGLLIYYWVQDPTFKLLTLCLVLGSFFGVYPDFDFYLSRKLHRSWVSHSFFTAVFSMIILYTVFMFFSRLQPYAFLGSVVAFLATLSHILSDMLTDYGVPLLWPIRRKRISLTPINSVNRALNTISIMICLFFIYRTIILIS